MWQRGNQGDAGMARESGRSFLDNKVRAEITGLNGEGAPGSNRFLMFFFSKLWLMVKLEVMPTVQGL